MAQELLIGCDIGTSGTKSVVVDKNGVVLSHALKNYGLITEKNQWAEQWPDVWLDAAVETIKEAVAAVDPSNIAGLCISALYGGTGVLCTEDYEPVRPSIIWMDRRAELESNWIKENIGEDYIFDISGNGVDSYFGFTKLLWVQNNEPDNWQKIRKIIPVHSYILYKLTGKETVDYCSAGNVGGIYDYKNHDWSADMAGKLNIDMEALPTNFYKPSDVVGVLKNDFASMMNLPSGVPVCAGTVDCIASMLSAAIVKEGDSAAILGTSLNLGFIHSETPSDKNLISMPYCIDPKRLSYTYGGASTAGALPRWFVKNFMEDESQETYSLLEKEIHDQKIPAGADGLMILPYFMGERTPVWDDNATGMMIGLTLMHTRAHIYRAILESTAYSLKHIMQVMTGDKKVNKIVLVGGGSKSPLWKQIFADMTGVPVFSPVNTAEAPLGDAFLAGIGTGIIPDYNLITKWVEFDEPVEPDRSNNLKYQKYFEVYKDLYPAVKGAMWRLKKII